VSSYDPGSGPPFPDYGNDPGLEVIPGGGRPGRYGPARFLPWSRRGNVVRVRRRGRLGCFGLLVVLAIVLAVVYIGPNP